MNRKLLALIVVTAVATPVVAAPLIIQHIPPGANWVLHLDADAVRQTQLGRQWLATLTTPEANRGFDAFKLIFNFDPRQDLSSITLLGRDKDPDRSVAIFRGQFDTPRLVTFVRANATYQSETHRQHTLHSWIDEKKPTKRREYGCIYPDGSVLIGGRSMLRDALDALDGQTTGFVAAWLAGLPTDALLCGAADLASAGSTSEAAVFRHATSGQFALRETAGTVIGSLTLVGTNAEVAALLETAAKGVLAMILLSDAEEPELAELARTATIRTSGNAVTLQVQGSVANVLAFLQRQEAKKRSATTP